MLVMDSEGMLQALDPQQVVCHQNTAPEPVGGARALRSLRRAETHLVGYALLRRHAAESNCIRSHVLLSSRKTE